MTLERDPNTGKFVMTTAKAIQRHRSNRKQYVKHNLRPRRLGLVEWLASVFKFGPNPFITSPIADFIAKQVRLVRLCGLLRATGETVDNDHHVVLQVRGGLQDHLSDAETEADTLLDGLDNDLNQEEAFLDECRPDTLRKGLEEELRKAIKSADSDFGPLAARAAEAKLNLTQFRANYALPTHLHWGEHFTTGNIALIAAVVLFEFLLNSIFFAAANPLGLLGGGALALILSIATIVLGVAGGIAFQYNHPRSDGGGWFGKILLTVVALAAIFYLLLLTLARMAGEAGDLYMFHTAANEIAQHPIAGLFDLPSLGYFFFSIGVITYTGYKYVSILGRFPGLRKRVLQAERTELAWDQEVAGALDYFRVAGRDHSEALNSLPFFIQATVLPIKNVEQDYENVVDQLVMNCQSIGNAGQLLFAYIRAQVAQATIDTRSFADTECATMVEKYGGKLDALRTRAAQLIGRDEIKPATIERCREAMAANLQDSLDGLQDRCAEIKEARLRDMRIEMSENPASMLAAGV